jgi:hypothetical protein
MMFVGVGITLHLGHERLGAPSGLAEQPYER